MAQAKKAEANEQDIINFMNSVLSDMEKLQKSLKDLTELNKHQQDKIDDLSVRLQTIESIPLLASHIRTQNASPTN